MSNEEMIIENDVQEEIVEESLKTEKKKKFTVNDLPGDHLQ